MKTSSKATHRSREDERRKRAKARVQKVRFCRLLALGQLRRRLEWQREGRERQERQRKRRKRKVEQRRGLRMSWASCVDRQGQRKEILSQRERLQSRKLLTMVHKG